MNLTQRIKETVAGLIDAGTHLDAAKTTAKIAKQLGLSERLINYTHIEVRNRLAEFAFRRVPYKQRIVFLPQCLRNSAKCKAVMGEYGWACKKCGGCKVPEIEKAAKKLGYANVFVVPGGSMVHKIIKKHKPKGVIGVSCFPEMSMAIDQLRGSRIAPQGVLLLREGCKDTDVNLEELGEKLGLIESGKHGRHGAH